MSNGEHVALHRAVQMLLASMETLDVDKSGIARGSWCYEYQKKINCLMAGPAPTIQGAAPATGKLTHEMVFICHQRDATFGRDASKFEACATCILLKECTDACRANSPIMGGVQPEQPWERPVKLPPPPIVPEQKGFGLDAQIDKIMATMPKDWNGKYFFLMISRMVETFIRKNTDYAGQDNQATDCLANFRAASQLGVTPLKGVLVRCSDKWMRIQNLTREERAGMVKDEAIVDTMLDLANYMIIAVMVHMTTQDIKGE